MRSGRRSAAPGQRTGPRPGRDSAARATTLGRGVVCAFTLAALGACTLAQSGAAKAADRMPPAFKLSIGLTRAQVEARFHEIDGANTMFKSAPKVNGVARVLGGDRRLFTIIEVNGYPEVTDVQVVTLLDTSSKKVLEDQVIYDSLACGVLAGTTARDWCTERILNTSAHGLATASKSGHFGPLRITVKTYQSAKSPNPPVVSLNVAPV